MARSAGATAKKSKQQFKQQQAIILRGILSRVKFHNPSNGWSVLQVEVKSEDKKTLFDDDFFTAVGNIPSIRQGDEYELTGTWKEHPQFGKQFAFDEYKVILPTGKQGAAAYLTTLSFGIGPVKAKKIVDILGENALQVITNEPTKLIELDFITKQQAQDIIESLAQNTILAELSAMICKQGVTPALAARIYAQYGSQSIEVVKENPYILADEVWGIGFKKADSVAQSIGIEPNSPFRIEAALKYMLKEAGQEGHVFLRPRDTVAGMGKFLGKGHGVEIPEIKAASERLIQRGEIIREGDAMYYRPLYEAESNLAKNMRMLATQEPIEVECLEEMVEAIQIEHGVAYAEEQKEAIKKAMTKRLVVVTGGPGTGKCVSKGTLVLTKKGIVPIETLAPTPNCPEDTAEELQIEIESRNGRAKTSHFYHGGIKKTIVVKTKAGFKIEGTPNHRILCINENGPDWKRLDQITAVDYVAINRGSELWHKLVASDKDVEVAYLMGMLTGDGSRGHDGLSFHNPEPELLESVQRTMNEFYNYPVKIHRYNENCPVIKLLRKDVKEDLIDRGYCHDALAGDKEVPLSIMTGSKWEVIAFLQGLFDTDGSSDKRNGYIEWITKSVKLAKQVQVILANLGIIAYQSEKKVTYDKIERSYVRTIISGKEARKFYQVVGFRLPRKQEGVKRLPDNSNTNLDVIPGMGEKIRKLMHDTGPHSRQTWWKWKKECNGNRNPSQQRVQELIKAFEESAATIDEGLKEAANPLIYWDQVSTISNSKAEVYDLTVPGHESFVANGFINHNTTVIKGIIAAYQRLTEVPFPEIYLASPTGRAAKRMTEATGYEAKTIHRLLVYNPHEGGFMYNERQQLDPGLLIVDEFSMADIELSNDLFKAVPPDMQVVLVGDIDQLPSVGPGSVLRDTILSKVVPTVRLKFNYRQAGGSIIAENAHYIVKGDMPSLYEINGDWETRLCIENEDALEIIKGEVKLALERGMGIMDFQVLAPMRRGACGVDNLNQVVRELVNPSKESKPELKRGKDKIFRLGDKVMVTKNNYRLGVFNGDLGIITEVAEKGTGLKVNFEGEEVFFNLENVDLLTLAYASTIHKSQGSEFPLAIVVCVRSHWIMLQRNLLYTGITRAKNRLVLVCQEEAVERCVNNNEIKERRSLLAERLRDKRESSPEGEL